MKKNILNIIGNLIISIAMCALLVVAVIAKDAFLIWQGIMLIAATTVGAVMSIYMVIMTIIGVDLGDITDKKN